MHAAPVAIACGLVLLAGCGQDSAPDAATTGSPVELADSGACGDAFFWAATGPGDLAVTVAVDARDRSAGEPTTRRFSIPAPAVDVSVLSGSDLARNFCTDLPDPSANPAGTQTATDGTGVLAVGPRLADYAGCGHVRGTLSLDGLVAEDGTVFAPIRVTTEAIGCYSG
jgi:hypothetical protein